MSAMNVARIARLDALDAAPAETLGHLEVAERDALRVEFVAAFGEPAYLEHKALVAAGVPVKPKVVPAGWWGRFARLVADFVRGFLTP